jgi:hypothetical protein
MFSCSSQKGRIIIIIVCTNTMPVRATRRVHPSASRADPPQKSFTSSVSLVGGGGAAKKQRRALSDASNNVDNASKSRPNRNNGRKNAPVMMESTLCSLSRDDPVQPPPVVANERKDVLYAIEKRAKKVLDALLDELDGDCACTNSHQSFVLLKTRCAFDSTSFSP